MPHPMKPCTGSFSEEIVALLQRNLDRAQWLLHVCTECQKPVGARLEQGRWQPEVHWPSVPPLQRTKSANRYSRF